MLVFYKNEIKFRIYMDYGLVLRLGSAALVVKLKIYAKEMIPLNVPPNQSRSILLRLI